ncbi:hypothetical protein IP86_23155 [Rhodopseudomonas sp. AAP120]|uniref:hypothetical protein n=1 Tax=Rhodopseudomonas sp. AAP120 TaxID=1523430 RepID=UPI0006B9225A|nr:hypothetical protein [Rhodopseudomonas sp. AAP120]KPF94099.1 hypothetical protein IP86_23155 [Rhodopseudomonas sp. AAP120]
MTLFLAIRRLLAVVMVAGLVLAPLARPVMAGAPSALPVAMHGMSGDGAAMHGTAMQHMPMQHMAMQSTADQGMADQAMADHAIAGHDAAPAAVDDMSAAGFDEIAEMPCCPSETPKAPVDCGKCLSMAGCSAGFLTGMPGAVAVPLPILTGGTTLANADFARDGLGHPPPEHPPRSLV